VNSSLKAFEEWRNVSPTIRARYVFKTAALMRKRKAELTAVMILESGKNWAEADGDVAEAIDFLDFYGTRALQMAERQPLSRVKGEDNDLCYIPLGVGVIISPWNFPLAILTGMTCGPLVMGNSVILKPASNTPVIAYKFFELMEEAGVPKGVINLVYGGGSTVGTRLVRHPKIRFINFTGSKEVGLFIMEEAGKVQNGQKWIKRASVEMGGKNAIIVDSEADLDSAVACIAASAFGFQGQKCSACSRAIIDQKVYDYVEEQLIEKAKSIKVGPVEKYENKMGPLIDQAALDKVLKYIDIGKQEGRLLCGGNRLLTEGYYIEPTIFSEFNRKIAWARKKYSGRYCP
jgi:1-pyrroline-5-carboxylate dehydrogenase